MSKDKEYLNRLKALFSKPENIEPDPSEEAQTLPISDADHWSPPSEESSASAFNELLENESEPWEGEIEAPLERKIGWEEFLDAIDRSEEINFTFDKDDSKPLIPSDETAQIEAPNENVEGTTPEGGNILEIPLSVGDTEIGALLLEADKNRPWSSQEANVAANVARQVAQHIENLRLVEQAERFREEAEQAVRRLIREGWDGYMQTPAAPTPGYIYDNKQVKPIDSEAGTIGEQSAIETSDLPAVEQELKVRDEAIGKIVVEQANPEASDLLQAVADRLSLHIEGLRLLDETERARQQLDKRAAELETVARVSTAAASILDPQMLLQSVVDLTRSSFNLYHAHIYLLAENGENLILKASAGKAGRSLLADGHIVPLNQGTSIITKAAQTRQGLIINDLKTEPEYQLHPLLTDAQSELAVPMVAGDQLLGVFNVQSDMPNRFTEDDLQTYATLAAQVAVAMRNAELYAEQIATVERLKELDHLKSSFLANISHELRTPLNSILGFTQLMMEGLDGPLTENMANDLELIEKNSQHLLNLINDVLDMAKIEAGRMSLNIEPMNLKDLIEDVLKTTSALARDRTLYQNLEIGPREDYDILADRLRLRQILLNLVGNAVKFTEQGGITIQAVRSNEDILVRIQDTGIGIPPDKLQKIFEAFSQVDTSTTRKVGGTGLGLPISRRLLEMHGGQLWAESKGIPGEGSTFFLRLPIHQQEDSYKGD